MGRQSDEEKRDERAPPRSQLQRGVSVGRYLVLDRVGGGGMGDVYAAYDPELNRKVAIKLLRRRDATEHARARLLREAQAMARLSHPNVVPVHDVGTIGGEVFIAMELVDGVTIRGWLADKPRRPREILRVFLAAGEGLACAHAAGIVHRDFKPDNVLVDKHGRVRVLDFGLARAAGDAPTGDAPADQRPPSPGSALDSPLTQEGTFLGTPAFMSPEQLQGETADARSDQFSFCVALYRALYDDEPFAGDSPEQLYDAIVRQQVRPSPRGAQVPSRWRRTLLRGMRAQPAERHPSMEALLAELARDLKPSRRGVTVAALVLLAAGGAVTYRSVSARDQVCRGAGRVFDGVWDASRRADVHGAFAASNLPYAETAFASVARLFDDYARDWVQMRTSVCEATRVRGVQSEELLDLRMQCLDERLAELRQQSDLLSHADGKAIEKAVTAADALSPVADCANTVALQRPVPRPANPALRTRVRELGVELARAKALGDSGQVQKGLALAQAAVDAARPLGYKPLVAEALLRTGILISLDYSDDKRAADTLTEAILAAKASRDSDVEAAALVWLVFSDISLHKRDEARAGARLAEAAIEGLGGDHALTSQLDKALGHLAYDEESYDEALRQYSRELALDEKNLGPEARAVAFDCINVALSDIGLDRFDAAAAALERALTILTRTEGTQSPAVAWPHDKLGIVLEQLGRYRESLEHLQTALTLREHALGPDHVLTADSLANLGVVALDLGRWDEAEAYTRRALAIEEKVLGPDDGVVTDSLDQLAQIYQAQGKLDAAQALYKRAIATVQRLNGAQAPSLGTTLAHLATLLGARRQWSAADETLERALAIAHKQAADGLGVADVLTRRGELALLRSDAHRDVAAALDALSRALAIRDQALGPQHPLTARTLVALGEAELASGDGAQAAAHGQRALAALDGKLADPGLAARARFVLARALDGSQRERACALVREARQLYATTAATGHDAERAAVDAWRARRCP